jgi:hypothetical protein
MTIKPRVYFFDANGNELSTGLLFYRGLDCAPLKRNGDVAGLYRIGVHVCRYYDMNRIVGERAITLADFPGHERIGVKVWIGDGRAEKFWLVNADYFTSRESAQESPKLRIVS